MLARNDFLDFQLIGTGPLEAEWLTHMLKEHPSVALARQDRQILRGSGTGEPGQLHFSLDQLCSMRAGFASAGPLTVLGGVDVNLMMDPSAASRLAGAFPQLKLIAFLRDPAELLLDIYKRHARFAPVSGKLLDELQRHPEWLDRTRYHRHLQPFLDRFHVDQICLVIHERFFAQERQNYERLCTYIGVDSEYQPLPFENTIPQPRLTGRLKYSWRKTAAKIAQLPDDLPQQAVDDETRWRILDQLDGEMRRLEQALALRLDIWRGEPKVAEYHEPAMDNVIPLPAGAERRQRLADRRARVDASV